MSRRMVVAVLAVALLTGFAGVWAADAPPKEEKKATKVEPAKKPAIEVVNVVIHPAAEPKPALKYHLLPTYLESTPGEAVPLYLKATIEYVRTMTRIGESTALSKEFDLQHAYSWSEMPLDKLPRKRVRKLVDAFDIHVMRELDSAVRRERCTWDTPMRQGNVFAVLLPETQEFRNMARIVALRARLQIAEGKYADAVESLKTGYGMGRHIAGQQFLVSNLVGLMITNMMNDQLLTLCQQPNAPNMYWSIAELPSPWTDNRQAIGFEYDGVYLQWPELQTLRRAQYVPEQWNFVLRKFVKELVRMEDDPPDIKDWAKWKADRAEKTIKDALAAVPKIKPEMVAMGYAQKQVDAMCPAQIVMLYSLEAFDRARDNIFKWWNLPYNQLSEGINRKLCDIPDSTKQEIIPIARTLLPSVVAAKLAFGRTDRQFAVLRCIEALRMYAASHDGRLPASLDEIKEVPIPRNPLTGKPFPYRLEGQTAVLEADGDWTNTPRPQYHVTVAK